MTRTAARNAVPSGIVESWHKGLGLPGTVQLHDVITYSAHELPRRLSAHAVFLAVSSANRNRLCGEPPRHR
jgi:hypothetical protein